MTWTVFSPVRTLETRRDQACRDRIRRSLGSSRSRGSRNAQGGFLTVQIIRDHDMHRMVPVPPSPAGSQHHSWTPRLDYAKKVLSGRPIPQVWPSSNS